MSILEHEHEIFAVLDPKHPFTQNFSGFDSIHLFSLQSALQAARSHGWQNGPVVPRTSSQPVGTRIMSRKDRLIRRRATIECAHRCSARNTVVQRRVSDFEADAMVGTC